jgi:soluble lytic murein transglycosylase-like protein
MTYQTKRNDFSVTCRIAVFLSVVFIVASLCVAFFFPTRTVIPFTSVVENETENNTVAAAGFDTILEDVGYSSTAVRKGDDGLSLYRQPSSKAAVEWFYLHVTGNRDVAMAILESADKNDIPLSLAFALAYTESHYNIRAINNNKNNSIDRGLFQLNSSSFPQLTEADFFTPSTSARYGLAHLRFCLNVAGNEVSALAMYNAGTNKVRANNTPQTTLNYIGRIMVYQQTLEKLFADEVLTYYDTKLNMSTAVAYQK